MPDTMLPASNLAGSGRSQTTQIANQVLGLVMSSTFAKHRFHLRSKKFNPRILRPFS